MKTPPLEGQMMTSPVETLVSGLTFQWILNGEGIAFTAQHSSAELVDAWANKIIQVAESWPADKILFLLNDFSGKDCVSTPYNQQKNRELARMFPHLKSVTALVVKNNLTMQLSRIFIRLVPLGNKKVHMCFDRSEALQWLQKQYDMTKS